MAKIVNENASDTLLVPMRTYVTEEQRARFHAAASASGASFSAWSAKVLEAAASKKLGDK